MYRIKIQGMTFEAKSAPAVKAMVTRHVNTTREAIKMGKVCTRSDENGRVAVYDGYGVELYTGTITGVDYKTASEPAPKPVESKARPLDEDWVRESNRFDPALTYYADGTRVIATLHGIEFVGTAVGVANAAPYPFQAVRFEDGTVKNVVPHVVKRAPGAEKTALDTKSAESLTTSELVIAPESLDVDNYADENDFRGRPNTFYIAALRGTVNGKPVSPHDLRTAVKNFGLTLSQYGRVTHQSKNIGNRVPGLPFTGRDLVAAIQEAVDVIADRTPQWTRMRLHAPVLMRLYDDSKIMGTLTERDFFGATLVYGDNSRTLHVNRSMVIRIIS